MKNKLWILFLLLFLTGAGLFSSFLFLKRNSMGTETLRSELENIFRDLPHMKIHTEEIQGNPLTGFTITNMELTSENGSQIIQASSVKLGFEKMAFLRGRVKVRDISFVDGNFDSVMIASIISGKGKLNDNTFRNTPEKLQFQRCSLTLGSSLLKVEDLVIKIPGQETFQGGGEATFNDLDFNTRFSIVRDGSRFRIDKLDLFQGETALSLTGTAGEKLDLEGTFSTPDLSFISTLIPYTASARMSGGVATDLSITGNPGNPFLRGNLLANDFSVARFLFNEGRSDWEYSNRILSFREIESKVFGSSVWGELDIIFKDGPLGSRLKLKGKNLNVEDWRTPLSWLSFARGRVEDVEVDLKGPFRKLTGNVSLNTFNRTVIEEHPFDELAVNLKIEEGKDISFEGNGVWYGNHLKADGTVKIAKPRTKLDIIFETGDLDIHQLKDAYTLVDDLDLQGTLAGRAILKGPTNDLEFSGSFGSDKLRLQEHILRDLKFTFHHLGSKTIVETLKLKWNESTLNGKGTITDLTGTSPRGDVSFSCPTFKVFRTLNLKDVNTSGSFEKTSLTVKTFTSNLAGGKLSLSGQMGFNKGEEPDLNLKGSSRTMKAGELASQLGVPLEIKGKIDSEFSVLGSPSNPEVAAVLNSSELDIKGLVLSQVKASIKARDEKLFIKGLKADLAGSPLRSSGTIDLAKGDQDSMDIRTTVESLDLFSLTGKTFPDLPVSGVVSTDISLQGALKSPELVLSASADRFNLAGLSFSGMELELRPPDEKKGPMEYFLKAYMGEFPLEIIGTAAFVKDSGLEIYFDSRGKDLDAQNLTEKVNGNLGQPLQGKFNLACKGHIKAGNITGEGILDSPRMAFMGYTMDQLHIPFTFNGKKLECKEGTSLIYGGKVQMQGQLDLEKARWETDLHVKGADLTRFSKEFREFRMKSTGKADLEMNLSGVLGKVYLLSGTGSLTVNDGSVGGFHALKSLTKDGILKYRTLSTCFNLDGGNLYLLPGSRASAYPDDKVYKYLSFSGALGGPSTKMDLMCSGQINTQALNALQGVMQGIVRSGNGGDPDLLLQDFLSGLVGGYSGPDFRMISFELAGTWSKPALYSLKVDSSLKTVSSIPVDEAQGSPSEKEIKFEVNIPTGEGADTSASAGDQFRKQVMENILKQIFIDEDDINNGNGN